jgi:2-succinyl-6-hydroxy-2,4-cyclohexadiene-1-carboxylate synthase
MPSRLLSHRVYGRPDCPALLLLHGFLGCKEDWHDIAPALSHDHFVVAVDLPGHGESVEGFSERDYTMIGCAELLVGLLNSLKVNTCSVAGYSMGGRMALYFAVHNADRCNRIILESASPGLHTEAERATRRTHDEAHAQRLLTEALEPFLNDWYAQPLFESLRKIARFGELLERRYRNNPQALALSLRHTGTGAQPSLWGNLGYVNLPILLLTGELDPKFTQIAREMAAVCPHCRTCVIAGVGHTLHFEAPDRYIAAVQDFLMERK